MRRSIIGMMPALAAVLAFSGVRADDPEGGIAAKLEFRILADVKHDREAAEKAKAVDTLEHPPAGYRWVWLGETLKGSDPSVKEDRITVSGAKWKEGEFAGATVHLSGINLGDTELSRDFEIAKNTADTLQLRPRPSLFYKSVSSYRIDRTPSRAGLTDDSGLIIKEVDDRAGRIKRSILVKLDRHNVTDRDLKRVYPTSNELLRPAIGFELTKQAGERFGALTREHLPEPDGAFKYQIGIILEGRLLSAPTINSEIRYAGIIEFGNDARPEEVERIIKILTPAKP